MSLRCEELPNIEKCNYLTLLETSNKSLSRTTSHIFDRTGLGKDFRPSDLKSWHAKPFPTLTSLHSISVSYAPDRRNNSQVFVVLV